MRKIIICTLVFIALVLSFGACAGNNEKTPNEGTGEDISTTGTNKEPNDPTTNINSNNDILVGTYKVPLQKIFVDTPNFNLIEEGYTRIFFDSGRKYVTFTCLYDEPCDDLSAAHDKTVEIFMQNVVDHHHVNSMGSLDDATVTINGIATYRYEGNVNAGTNPVYDAYIYGYSFVYNGFPCSIVGVVSDETQPEAEKQLVKLIVDEMMKTVRNTK